MSSCGGECSVDGCMNQARRRGLCWSHLWRARNGKLVNSELRVVGRSPLVPKTPWEKLVAGCYQLVEDLEATGSKDPKGDIKRAQSRFLMVKKRYDKAIARRSAGSIKARTGQPARNQRR